MNVIEEMKLLSEDHSPDGWPAVKMSEIAQLIEIIEKQAERIAELEEWLAAISDDHPKIPEWIQQSASSLLANQAVKGGE